MKTSEKIRKPATKIGGTIRSMPTQWYETMADEVAELESALETIKNYAIGGSIVVDLEGEGFKEEGTVLFMIEETALQALGGE